MVAIAFYMIFFNVQMSKQSKSTGISGLTVKVELKFFQQSIFQRQMESLNQSVIVQTNKISELLSYYLQARGDFSLSSFNKRKQIRFVDQKLIQIQINELKCIVKKITQTYQSLQKENKVLKRMITRSGQTSSTFSIKNQNNSSKIENYVFKKYPFKVTSSDCSNDFQMSSFQQNQSQVSLFNSFVQLDKIKQEVSGLTEGLKSIEKAYEKYELDSTDDREIKDIFLDQLSLARFGSQSEIKNNPSSSTQETSLENLLCYEELSFDDMPLGKNYVQKVNSEQNMVQSLIAKGIEFRESRAIRSKQYQTLSDLIKQYREDIKNKENITSSKVKQTSKYR